MKKTFDLPNIKSKLTNRVFFHLSILTKPENIWKNLLPSMLNGRNVDFGNLLILFLYLIIQPRRKKITSRSLWTLSCSTWRRCAPSFNKNVRLKSLRLSIRSWVEGYVHFSQNLNIPTRHFEMRHSSLLWN